MYRAVGAPGASSASRIPAKDLAVSRQFRNNETQLVGSDQIGRKLRGCDRNRNASATRSPESVRIGAVASVHSACQGGRGGLAHSDREDCVESARRRCPLSGPRPRRWGERGVGTPECARRRIASGSSGRGRPASSALGSGHVRAIVGEPVRIRVLHNDGHREALDAPAPDNDPHLAAPVSHATWALIWPGDTNERGAATQLISTFAAGSSSRAARRLRRRAQRQGWVRRWPSITEFLVLWSQVPAMSHLAGR